MLARMKLELEKSEKKYSIICSEKKQLISALKMSKNYIADLNNFARNLKIEVTSNLMRTKNDILSITESIVGSLQTATNEADFLNRKTIKKENDECTLRENVHILKKELIVKEERHEQILEDLECSKQSLEKQLGESKGLIKKLEHDLENTLMALDIKDKQLSKLQSNVDNLQGELSMVRQIAEQRVEKYENCCKEKDLEIQDTKQKYEEKCRISEELENGLKIIEQKYKNMNETCYTLQEEKDKLRNTVTDLEEQFHMLKNSFTAVCEEKTRLNKSLKEMTDILHGHEHEIKELNSVTAALTEKLRCANDKSRNESLKNEELSAALAEAKKVNDTMNSKLVKLEEMKSKCEESLKRKQQESNKDKSKLQSLESALHLLQDDLMIEKQNLEAQLSDSMLEIQRLQEGESSFQADLKKQEKLIQEQQSKYEDKVKQLKSELKRVLEHDQEILKQKQTEFEDLLAEKNNLQMLLDMECKRTEEIENKLDECSTEKKKLLDECAFLKEREMEQSKVKSELEDKLHAHKSNAKLLEEEVLNLKKASELLQKNYEEQNVHNRKLKEDVENLKQINKCDKDMDKQHDHLTKSEFEKKQSIVMEDEDHLRCELAVLTKQCNQLTAEKLELLKETETLRNAVQGGKQKDCLGKETKLFSEQADCLISEDDGILHEQEKNFEERLLYQKTVQELEDSRLHFKNLLLEKNNLEKQLETTLIEKTELEHRLNSEIERAVVIENGVLLKLKMVEVAKDQLEKHLEDVTNEKTGLEHRLNVQVEKLTELEMEKLSLEEQLENVQSDKLHMEKKLSELDDVHSQRLKQLVQEFECKLGQKEEEISNLQESKFERKEMDENQQIREYREYIRDLQEEVQGQGEAYEQLMEQHKEELKAKGMEINNVEMKLKNQLAVHQQEITESDRRWRHCLEQQLAEAEARHKEELMELSKEWHWERKNHVSDTKAAQSEELENTSQLAVAAVESGTGSIELLHRQLVAQANELKEAKRLHKLEVTELRRLLSLRKSSGASLTLEDACTELEYLRNILYEYMMGKEPLVLARVISAVVKFDSDQTARVLQKEEQKQTLLGHLGILS